MNRSEALNVGLKILGVYFMVTGIAALPGALATFGLLYSGEMDGPLPYGIFALGSPIILILSGITLSLNTSAVVKYTDTGNTSEASMQLSVGSAVKLLGLYLVAASVSSLSGNFSLSSSLPLSNPSLYVPRVIVLMFGLALAFKGQYIWVLLHERFNRV